MRSLSILLFLMIVVTDSSPLLSRENVTINQVFYRLGLQLEQSANVQIKDQMIRAWETKKFITIMGEDGKLYFEIEITTPITPSKAETLAVNQYSVIEGLYYPRPTPYYGEVSRSIACPKKLRPMTQHAQALGRSIRLLLAPASERHNFGVCVEDLVHFNGGFAAFFVPKSRSLLQFRFFVPKSAASKKKATAIMAGFLKRVEYQKKK